MIARARRGEADLYTMKGVFERFKNDTRFRSVLIHTLEGTKHERQLKDILDYKMDKDGNLESMKSLEELSPRERRLLGVILSYAPVQQLRMSKVIEEIQTDDKVRALFYQTLTPNRRDLFQRMLFAHDKDTGRWEPKPVKDMKPAKKALLARAFTGLPEWIEDAQANVSEWEAAKAIRERALEDIQTSPLLSEEAKAILTANPKTGAIDLEKKSIEDIIHIGDELKRLEQQGRQELRDAMEREQRRYREVARELFKRVPVFIGGKRLSKMKEYRGAFSVQQAYQAGDLVMYGEEVKKARVDISGGSAFNAAEWETAWSPYQERNRDLWSAIKNKYIEAALDPDRMAQVMFDEMGLKPGEGYAWRELIRMRDGAYGGYLAQKTRRLRALYGDEGLLKKAGVRDKDFMVHTFKAGNMGQVFSLDQVMYLWAAEQNERSYAAVLGSVFLTQAEKRKLGSAEQSAPAVYQKAKREYGALAAERYRALLDEYDAWRKKDGNEKYHAIIVGIMDELRAEKRRLFDFAETWFNMRVHEEDNYIPLRRIKLGAVDESFTDQWRELTGAGFKSALDKGTLRRRADIPLQWQEEINYNLFDVYNRHVEQVESLIAFTPWVRKMRGVFQGRSMESRSLRDALTQAYGDMGARYWDEVVNRQINGGEARANKVWDKLTYLIRGAYVKGLIIGRLSSVATQLITSLPQSAFDVSPQALAAGLKVWDPKTLKQMPQASPYMANRSMIEELSRSEEITSAIEDYKPGGGWHGLRPLDRAWEKYGSMGLNWADRVSVAPVFHGIYLTESQKLIDKSDNGLKRSEENPYIIMGEGGMAVREEAIAIAERVVRQSQPDNDPFNKPKILWDKSGLNIFFTNFANPFVTLWNKVTFDALAGGLKNPSWEKFGMFLWGALLMGTGMLLMGALRDDEKDELKDADFETWRKHILSWLLGGYGMFGNTPFLGSALGSLAEIVITGDAGAQSFGQDMTPAVTNISKLVKDFTNHAETHKIIIDVFKIVLMYTGTGYGALTDLEAALKMENAPAWRRALRAIAGVR